MPLLIKIPLLFIWYLLTAAGSYGLLITYLNIAAPINLSGDIIKYGAYGCLAVSLIVAFLLVRPTRVVKKKKDEELSNVQLTVDSETDAEPANEMTLAQAAPDQPDGVVNENTDLNASGQIAFSLDQPETEEPKKSAANNEAPVSDSALPAKDEVVAAAVSQPAMSDDENQPGRLVKTDNEAALNEASGNLALDAVTNPTVSQPIDQPSDAGDGQAVNEPNEEAGLVEMTNTQQQFIQNSKNSYINTEGLPQFKVTKQIDAQAIIAKENERLDMEEQSEKHHSQIDFLTVILIIILIVVVGCLGYVVYRLFF